MSCIELLTLAPDGNSGGLPLPLDAAGSRCEVRLRCLPGASGVHVALAVDGELQRRAALAATSGEVVVLEVELGRSGALHLDSASGPILDLPTDGRFAPAPAFRPPPLDRGLDLVVIVDGTVRTLESDSEHGAAVPKSRPLLADAAKRDSLAEQLLGFIDALGAREMRGTVLAFGDDPLEDATAPDLRPTYRLHPALPEDRVLRLTVGGLLDAMTALRPTPGADFVDALADALAACLELRWRPDARKMILVVGDSPGHSLLHPAPWGCDARARRYDVDVEALKLHRRGIQIVTLYCAPPQDVVLDYFEPSLREIFDHARVQYRRLASASELAFELTALDSPSAAAAVAGWSDWLARGAAWGELVGAATATGTDPQPSETAGGEKAGSAAARADEPGEGRDDEPRQGDAAIGAALRNGEERTGSSEQEEAR